MADRPILFSAPMIQALLAGRKTQTRRVHLTQDPEFRRTCENGCDGRLASMCILPAATCGRRRVTPTRYGIGDRLWVREAWAKVGDANDDIHACPDLRVHAYYRADAGAPELQRWRPSIHMPRRASRLTLIVTDVRVQRLRDISGADALAEGVEMESADPPFYYVPGIHPHSLTAVGFEEPGGRHAERSFAKLWDLINAKRGFGWATNPWVCALTFTVHRCNIDTMEAAGA